MKRMKVAGFSLLIALIVTLGGRQAATVTSESQAKGQTGDIPDVPVRPGMAEASAEQLDNRQHRRDDHRFERPRLGRTPSWYYNRAL